MTAAELVEKYLADELTLPELIRHMAARIEQLEADLRRMQARVPVRQREY